MGKFQVVFQPSGRRGLIAEGRTILQAAQELGVGIEAACGGAMVCGKCKVIPEFGSFAKLDLKSEKENISELSSVEQRILKAEEIARGYRQACCTVIKGDIVVSVPKASQSAKQVVLEEGARREIEIKPAVKNYYLELPEATLADARDDRQRVLDGLAEAYGLTGISFDYTVLGT